MTHKLSIASFALLVLSTSSALATTYDQGVPSPPPSLYKHYITAQVGGAFQSNKLSLLWEEEIYPDSTPNKDRLKKRRLKSSIVYDIAVGRKIDDSFYIGIEIAHVPRHNFKTVLEDQDEFVDTFHAHIKTTTVFANLRYQFQNIKSSVMNGRSLVPYITCGFGSSLNYVNKFYVTDLDSTAIAKARRNRGFAWQVGVGVLLSMQDDIDINISYNYRDLGKVVSNPLKETDFMGDTVPLRGRIRTSNILIGLTYKF